MPIKTKKDAEEKDLVKPACCGFSLQPRLVLYVPSYSYEQLSLLRQGQPEHIRKDVHMYVNVVWTQPLKLWVVTP